MSTKKRKPATKTISFRVRAEIYDSISAAATAKGMSQGEYIFSQVAPTSELGGILGNIAAKAIFDQPAMKDAFVGFIGGLVSMKEKNGLDNESFNEAIKDSLGSLLTERFGSELAKEPDEVSTEITTKKPTNATKKQTKSNQKAN